LDLEEQPESLALLAEAQMAETLNLMQSLPPEEVAAGDMLLRILLCGLA
jgi:hypothetical protein